MCVAGHHNVNFDIQPTPESPKSPLEFSSFFSEPTDEPTVDFNAQQPGSNFNNPMAFGNNRNNPFEVPKTTPPPTDTTKTSKTTETQPSSSKTATERLLDAINATRREHGLKELTIDPSLNSASKKNNDANNSTQVLDHHNGLINGSGGEITYGGPSTTDADADAAVQAWLSSPGHRNIMLDPNYTKLGADITGGYATANFA